jgi:hypothetical protein
MSTATLLVRRLVGELLEAEFAATDVEWLWNPPEKAEDLDSLRSAWWAPSVDVSIDPYTMPLGLDESATVGVVLQAMPADGDVSGRDAEDAVAEMYDMVFDLVRANPHPVDPAGVWDLQVVIGGLSFAHARSPQDPFGWAARFEVQLSVRATRCA